VVHIPSPHFWHKEQGDNNAKYQRRQKIKDRKAKPDHSRVTRTVLLPFRPKSSKLNKKLEEIRAVSVVIGREDM
jgi:hypothetical protein